MDAISRAQIWKAKIILVSMSSVSSLACSSHGLIDLAFRRELLIIVLESVTCPARRDAL